jgi:hypothetical protein
MDSPRAGTVFHLRAVQRPLISHRLYLRTSRGLDRQLESWRPRRRSEARRRARDYLTCHAIYYWGLMSEAVPIDWRPGMWHQVAENVDAGDAGGTTPF